MGCGPSKSKKSEIKIIDYDLSATYTLQMDQFFEEVKDCLKNIEQLRSDIEDSKENLMKDSYSIYLKAPCLDEALRIMFWCISANSKGNIQECRPELETSPPYLTMQLPIDTRSEVLQLWSHFTKYLDAVKNGPQIIQTEIENYEKYVDECNDFVENGLEEVLSVHETQLQKTQAALNISRNITKIQDQAKAVKRVKEIIEEAQSEAEEMTDFIQELIQTVDEVGLKAFNEGLFTPDEICLHFHQQLNKDAGDHDFQKSKLEFRQNTK